MTPSASTIEESILQIGDRRIHHGTTKRATVEILAGAFDEQFVGGDPAQAIGDRRLPVRILGCCR